MKDTRYYFEEVCKRESDFITVRLIHRHSSYKIFITKFKSPKPYIKMVKAQLVDQFHIDQPWRRAA